MTTYQKHWNAEIENLLNELGAPKSLEENIIDTLNNAKRTGIFPNQIINALRLGLSIKEGHQNMAFVASMQSGKSGTVYFLCNYVLPAIGLNFACLALTGQNYGALNIDRIKEAYLTCLKYGLILLFFG